MSDSPLFLRFVSLLIDDTNSMMNHGLKTLQEIRLLEQRMGELSDGKLIDFGETASFGESISFGKLSI